MHTDSSDGSSTPAPSQEITEQNTDVSEDGKVEQMIAHHSLRLNGKISCRAFNLLTGYDPPRAFFATDHGSFFIELGDAQIALFIEDGGAYLYKKIKEQK